MNALDVLAALDLPLSSRVDRRVPKILLTENGASTAADKRHIQEGIEELEWVAALKPSTIAIGVYRDDAREYLEIAVLRLCLRAQAKPGRLVELVHRAVPYPVFLVTSQGEGTGISLAHKRWSQGEAGKTVLDGEWVALEWNPGQNADFWPGFRSALALASQPRANLFALYQGWMDAIAALEAARFTGTFAVATTPAQAVARRAALRECTSLESEIARLRAASAKEKQIPRLVENNLELKRMEAELAAARARL